MRGDLKDLAPRVAVIESKLQTFTKVAAFFGTVAGGLASWVGHWVSGRH
jgi:hypothetical protein